MTIWLWLSLITAGLVCLIALRRHPRERPTLQPEPPLPEPPPPVERPRPVGVDMPPLAPVPPAPRPPPLVNVVKLLLFVLVPPYAFVVILIWVVQCLGSLIEALGALVEIIVDLVGLSVGSLLWALMRDPSSRHRALRCRVELGSDLRRLAASLAQPLADLAGHIGLGGLVHRARSKWRDTADLPVAALAPAGSICPFADRYTILDEIPGGGSTAELYVVRPVTEGRASDQRLLLKYFNLARGAWLENLVRESEGMRLAKRVGLVVDYEIGEDFLYYVMPYYEGRTLTEEVAELHRTLHSSQGLPEAGLRKVLGWIRDLLTQVSAFHEAGLFHKDIKPENIILTTRGPQLVDIGLLTQLQSAMTLTTHGTEYFRDPEMVRLAMAGTRVNEVEAQRFDLYSVGAVLYFVTQGTFPAMGPLSRHLRPVPYAVAAIANRAMSDLDKRYASAAAMRQDLETLLEARRLDRVQAAQLPGFQGQDREPAAAVASVPRPASPAQPHGHHGRHGSGSCLAGLGRLLFPLAVAGVVGLGITVGLWPLDSGPRRPSLPVWQHAGMRVEAPDPADLARGGAEAVLRRLRDTGLLVETPGRGASRPLLLLDATGTELIAYRGTYPDLEGTLEAGDREGITPEIQQLEQAVLARDLTTLRQQEANGELTGLLVVAHRLLAGLYRVEAYAQGVLVTDLQGTCTLGPDLVSEALELLQKERSEAVPRGRGVIVGRLLAGARPALEPAGPLLEAFRAGDAERIGQELRIQRGTHPPPVVHASLLESQGGVLVLRVRGYHDGTLVTFYRDASGMPVPQILLRTAREVDLVR